MKKAIGVTLIVLVTITFLSSKIPVNSEKSQIANWNYSCIVHIDNMDNPQILTDYQIFLNLDGNNFDFSLVQPDGDDLRFTNQNGDMLPFWMEFYGS